MVDCQRHPGVLLKHFDIGAGKSLMWCPQCHKENMEQIRDLLERSSDVNPAQPCQSEQSKIAGDVSVIV